MHPPLLYKHKRLTRNLSMGSNGDHWRSLVSGCFMSEEPSLVMDKKKYRTTLVIKFWVCWCRAELIGTEAGLKGGQTEEKRGTSDRSTLKSSLTRRRAGVKCYSFPDGCRFKLKSWRHQAVAVRAHKFCCCSTHLKGTRLNRVIFMPSFPLGVHWIESCPFCARNSASPHTRT